MTSPGYLLLLLLLSLVSLPRCGPVSDQGDGPVPGPTPGSPAEQREAPARQARVQTQPPGEQPGRGLRSIDSIREYREGRNGCPYVRRLEDVRRLDLSGVDFDAPVVARVNGQAVTRAEFRLWYALHAGQNGILRAQLSILTLQALGRMREERRDLSIDVAEEDIDARIRLLEDLARSSGEEALADYHDRIEQSIGMMKYRELLRARLESEQLLLPPVSKPRVASWNAETGLPDSTADLLKDQEELRDYLQGAYLSGEELPRMFRVQFVRMLQQELIRNADIRNGLEYDLPNGICMTVEGVSVSVEEVLEFVPDDRAFKEGALLLCILYRAIDMVLETRGMTLSSEEFEEIFRDHEAEYQETLFPLPNLIALRGFYNMSEYREYYRRRAAYERMIATSMTDEALETHFEGPGKLFHEGGRADCSFFFVSLTDTETRTGLKGQAAWDAALARIKEAQRALLNGMSEEEVRAEYCSTHQSFDRGVTTPRMRNELRQTFLENEYLNFIHGYSLADDVFYNRIEDDLVGPFRINLAPMPGMRRNLGYVLTRVKSFARLKDPKDFDEQKALVLSDILSLMFTYFAHECLGKASIELN